MRSPCVPYVRRRPRGVKKPGAAGLRPAGGGGTTPKALKRNRLQGWRPHVLPWEHEMVFDEPEEEDDDELEDS